MTIHHLYINYSICHFRNPMIGGTYHFVQAYILGLFKGKTRPMSMALYGTVPPFWDPEIPIEK